MKPVLRCIFVAAISLAAASTAVAQESWVGKTILTKKAGIKIVYTGDDGQQVVAGKLIIMDHVVLGDKDGWLQVSNGRGETGWFDKADAVLIGDAIGYFTERIRQNETDSGSYARRAWVWMSKGELDIALKDYADLLRLDPSAYAYNNRGNFWRRKKDYDKAIADYNEAIRLDSKYVFAYANRGTVWSDKKDYDKAIADYNEAEALKLDSNDSWATMQTAHLLATCPNMKYRDGKKAVTLAKKAIDLEKNPKPEFFEALAAAYAESGDFVEAVRWQEKALEDPQLKNDKDARRRLELYRDKKPYRQE